ncbi:hypothetical protein AOZ06_40730 [Kibdelosporangium phytohabitans]|uniref:Uncharacterized protein n=1 Tax=Kibdelosporangium phytohabitans TaxID=860235 RepID=A0A0N9I7X0_9PSEU|nr:hypothetical protein AOZ06_40730 [Kibdelosporangium phytohabitans]
MLRLFTVIDAVMLRLATQLSDVDERDWPDLTGGHVPQWRDWLRDQFRMIFRRQMTEQARLRMASWTSARRSVRMRNRRKPLSQANVRSTGQRTFPRPEPCSAPRRAMTGMMPRSRTKRRYLSWS